MTIDQREFRLGSLSHLNLNLATIDPPTIDLSYFPVQKLRLTSLFRTLKMLLKLSETIKEQTFELQKKDSRKK